MELSEQIANYTLDLTYEDIPEEAVKYTKLCILDYFSSAIAGARKKPISIIHDMVEEMGGKEQATLFTGGKTNVAQAALVNGASSHIAELDDIHKASIIHAATVVIPAALAIAEWKGLSGKDVITAVVAGYEVCYRVGESVSPSHYYYWHNTATCGTFGSAITAAKLLGLSRDQIVEALGNAGTQAAGLWEFIEDGAMTKQLHPGKAAMNGTMAALLAKRGFTGAKKILEGRRGFFQAMSENPNETRITERLGKEFKILENSFKVHASCRHTHHAMDLLIDLAKENNVQAEDVDSVKVRTYQTAIDITDNDCPSTIYASKFSLQYCASLAIVNKSGGLQDFSEENLWDENIRRVMDRVTVIAEEPYTSAYPEKWGCHVTLILKNGELWEASTDFPKGDPENPVNQEQLVDKFHTISRSLPEYKRTELVEKIMDMEQVTDISELMNLVNVPEIIK